MEGYTPNPDSEKSRADHLYDDLDARPESHHHSIGISDSQAVSLSLAKKRLTPVGIIFVWPLAAAPTGFLPCTGTSLLRASYPELFGVLGTTFGSVDSTHFTLPNPTPPASLFYIIRAL